MKTGAAVIAAVLVPVGCGAQNVAPGGAVKVVATTTQLGDVVKQIGGDDVALTQILRPNTDPHDYEPRPADVQAAADAALVVENGDNLDAWMGKVIDNAGGDPAVLDAGTGRPDKLPGERTGAEASRYDPHWWHDPVNVEYAVDRIRDALVRADPGAKAAFDRRAAAYQRKLERLDAGIRRCITAVPGADRKLVTDHDAFGYFAKRYGIDVIGAVIPSQTTQAQPSAGDLARLAAVIRREHVKAVFPETSVNPKLARAIARETGATADHTLYGDTLGPDGSAGATYLEMEVANANAMVKGFTGGRRGCTIPGL